MVNVITWWLTFTWCIADPTHVLEQDDVQVREDVTIEVGPVRILDS